MLAAAERERLLALMGVPTYVLRAHDSVPDATSESPSTPPAEPISQTVTGQSTANPNTATRPVQHASLDALTASIRASAEAMGKPVRAAPKRGPMPALIGHLPQAPGLQRDLARLFGLSAPMAPPAQWPAYAVVLGQDVSVPASVIAVRVLPPLRSASAKRTLWRQLRPLLATARPS